MSLQQGAEAPDFALPPGPRKDPIRLSDYRGENEDYGGLKGVANRSAFVVDRSGKIVYAWVSQDPSVMPDFEAILDAVDRAE